MTQHTIKLGGKEFQVENPLMFDKLKYVEPAMTRSKNTLIDSKKKHEVVPESFYEDVAQALSVALISRVCA